MFSCPWPGRERAAATFDDVFARTAAPLTVRAETAADIDFLDTLSIRCSPLAGRLPDPMIRQQAEFQRAGHEKTFPRAMRRIVLRDDRPVGRLAIDWTPEGSRCVDIAIVPELHGKGVGSALLGAWSATADRLALPATLRVRSDNPAVALYRRLGFVEAGDAADPLLTMIRTPAR